MSKIWKSYCNHSEGQSGGINLHNSIPALIEIVPIVSPRTRTLNLLIILVKKIPLKKPTSLMKDFFKKAVFLKIFLKLTSHQHLRQNRNNSGGCPIFIDIIFNLKLPGTIMTWNARSMHKLLEFEMFLRSNNIVTNKD